MFIGRTKGRPGETGRAPTPEMTHLDKVFSPGEIKLSLRQDVGRRSCLVVRTVRTTDSCHASAFCGMANPQPLLEGVLIAGTPLFLPARAKNKQPAPKQRQI